jgi:hypothetical protein
MPTPERRMAGAHICVPQRGLWWFVAMGVTNEHCSRHTKPRDLASNAAGVLTIALAHR